MQDNVEAGERPGPDRDESRARVGIWLLSLIAVAATVAGLYLGQDLFAPLVLAGLIYTLINAFVERIKQRRLFGHPVPGWAAHVLIVGALALIAIVLGNVLAAQVSALSDAAPRYLARFEELTAQLSRLLGPELMESATEALEEINVSGAVAGAAGSAGATFGMLSLVVMFLAFMLVDSGALRRKLPHMVADPARRAQVSEALDAMSAGVQRYMWTKTVVSALTGALSYVFMKIAGLDFAETWAILIFALNYIPTIGSIVGTVLPAVAALAQFDSAGPILTVFLGISAVQFVVGNVVEPAMSSRGLNLSPFWIVFSLTFWSMLWGIPGAFLSVPITVCIAIVFAQVPPLRPFGVMLAGTVPEHAKAASDMAASPPREPVPTPAELPGPDAPSAPRLVAALGTDLADDVEALRRDRQAPPAEATAEMPAAAPRPAPPPPPEVPEHSEAPEGEDLADWIAGELREIGAEDPDSPLHRLSALLGNLPTSGEEMREALAKATSELTELARKNPALAALAAAGLGILLGRLTRRR